MIDDINDIQSDVKIVAGDSQHDVVVASPANQFYRYEVLLEFEDRTRNLDEFTSIIADNSFKETLASVLGTKQDGTVYTNEDVDDLISARLDAYVSDFNIIRNSGTAATGIVRVYLSDASTVSWDNGTTFTSKSNATYTASSSVSNITPNFETATGLYYVDIPVTADVTGSASNATTGSVNNMDPKPTNFSYCLNQSSVDGGTDEEGDLDLIGRATEVWSERVNGSKGGFERLAEAQSYVDDSYATDEDDTDDDIYLGSVCDLYAQFSSEDTELVEENFYWPGEANNTNKEVFEFTPSKQPLLSSVDPIVFKYTTGGSEEQVVPDSTTTPATVVEIVKDTSTFAESVKANDKVKIQMELDTASYQRRIKVLYLYDRSPNKLQTYFDDETTQRMVGPSVLVKKASEVPVRVIVEPQIAFGYVESEVQTAITSNIQKYFNGGTTSYGKQFARLTIGQDVVHTDIANIILRTEGVVSYDRDTFFIVNTLNSDLSDPTVIKSNEYASLHDVLFVFNTYNLSNFTASSNNIAA
jgi:uncharacterized phage protein gp47/JayE